MPPRLAGSTLRKYSTASPCSTSRPRPRRAGNELRVGLDAVHLDPQLHEELHELTATEAEVDDRVAADELLGEARVSRAQLVAAPAEERRELVLAVPGVDRAPGNPLADLHHLLVEAIDVAMLLGDAHLEIVELLQHLRVELVADRRRELAEQGDRARDQPRLLLNLSENAVDLAAERTRHHPMREAPPGKPARRIYAGAREVELLDLAQRALELVVQRGSRARPHAEQTIEVLVERGLETLGVPARRPALLDPLAARRRAAPGHAPRAAPTSRRECSGRLIAGPASPPRPACDYSS